MKPRIIFCDFDGTLVGRDLIISPQVKSAIFEWIKRGNYFSLASGRQFAGAFETACRELQLTSPQITMNGGQIINPLTREILLAEYIDDDDIKEILSLLEKSGIYYWVEKDHAVYTSDGSSHPDLFGDVPFYHVSKLEVKNISKAGIVPTKESDDDLIHKQLVKKFPNTHFIRLTSPFGVNWDITAKGATKHTGVLKVMNMLTVARNVTVGIGDGENDFPLLEASGYKIAMGNAIQDLKSVADYVTTTYSEGGVANAITHLLTVYEKSE